MKTSKPNFAILIAALAAFLMSGCGKSNGPNGTNNGTIWGQGNNGGYVQGNACFTGQELQAGAFSLGIGIQQGIADYSTYRVQAQGVVTGGQLGYIQFQGNLGRQINGYASIMIQAQTTGQQGYASMFTGQGVLTLGSTIIQDIMQRYGYQVCFGAVSINTLYQGSTLYGGYVTLQLNNGQTYPILF